MFIFLIFFRSSDETVLFWSAYLSFLSHSRLNHVVGIVSTQQTKEFFPSCGHAKTHRLQLKLSFVPVSNFWITPQLSLRRGSRNTEDVEREHKDSTVARHLPLKGPWMKLQTENEKGVTEQGKLAPVAVLSTIDKRSVIFVVMGLTRHTNTHIHTHTHTQHTHRNQTGISGLPPDRCLLRQQSPLFFLFLCSARLRSRDSIWEKKQDAEREREGWRFYSRPPTTLLRISFSSYSLLQKVGRVIKMLPPILPVGRLFVLQTLLDSVCDK